MNKAPFTELLRLLHVVVNIVAAIDIILLSNINIYGDTISYDIVDKNQKSTLKNSPLNKVSDGQQLVIP